MEAMSCAGEGSGPRLRAPCVATHLEEGPGNEAGMCRGINELTNYAPIADWGGRSEFEGRLWYGGVCASRAYCEPGIVVGRLSANSRFRIYRGVRQQGEAHGWESANRGHPFGGRIRS